MKGLLFTAQCVALLFSAHAYAVDWVDPMMQTLQNEYCFRVDAKIGGPGKPKLSIDEKAREVFYLLTELRKISEDPANERLVESEVTKRFAQMIQDGKPIRMYIPCFPAKSPNHEKKTLGPDPDLAEEIAMARLSAVVEAMNQIHPTELVIASDGRVFADTWWSTDAQIDSYREKLTKMRKSDHIKIYDLNDFFPGLSPKEAREKILEQYAPTHDEIRASFENPDRLNLYKAFSKFIAGDTPPGDPALVGLGKNARERLFKERAIDDIRRSDALNEFLIQRLVKQEGYIRLSIRDSTDTPDKIGINLLQGAGAEFSASPWHSVIVVRKDGSYLVTKREDAEKAGYALVYKDGRPDHFEEK